MNNVDSKALPLKSGKVLEPMKQILCNSELIVGEYYLIYAKHHVMIMVGRYSDIFRGERENVLHPLCYAMTLYPKTGHLDAVATEHNLNQIEWNNIDCNIDDEVFHLTDEEVQGILIQTI